ncbi:MAG: SEC-C domain-containing protein [Kiritimatiellaeota bacterium]|nr:SEC-C domain-containing protein [Kiritimatiellota bacterium]
MANVNRDPNSYCPCGSGRKYKLCCMAQVPRAAGRQTSAHAQTFTAGPGANTLYAKDDPSVIIPADPKAFAGLSPEQLKKFRNLHKGRLQPGEQPSVRDYRDLSLEYLELVPMSRHFRHALAMAYLYLGDIDAALETCDKLIAECYTLRAMDFAFRAKLRYIRGDDAGAEADIAEAMRRPLVDPLDGTAICTYLAMERQHEKILALCETMLSWRNPDIMHFHAVSLLNLGQRDRAQKMLKSVSTQRCISTNLAARYLEMLETREPPQSIFGDWRYLSAANVSVSSELWFGEKVKAGFRYGKRTPSYHDRRWTLTVCEHIVENTVELAPAGIKQYIDFIALSKLPRATDALLALAAGKWLTWELRSYLVKQIVRYGHVKPGKRFKLYLNKPGTGTMIEASAFGIWCRNMVSLRDTLRRWRRNATFTRQLYNKYGHGASPEMADPSPDKDYL